MHLDAGALAATLAPRGRGAARQAAAHGSFDVAVVGAGVFGAWTAYHLRRAGRRVALLDAYGPGNARGSSGGQTRVIRMGYGDQEIYTRWSMRSMDLWKSLWGQQSDLPDYIWRNWAQMVAGLNKAGVPLIVGTDLSVPGIIPGYSVHEEMAIWQDAGIPPADVLRSATLVPVQFMGLADRLGTVAEGKTASLVLVKGNPLEDIRNARLIEGIFQRGKYYDRADLDRLLSEASKIADSSAGSGSER